MVDSIKPKVSVKKDKYITNVEFRKDLSKTVNWINEKGYEGYDLVSFDTPVTIGQGIHYVVLMKKK